MDGHILYPSKGLEDRWKTTVDLCVFLRASRAQKSCALGAGNRSFTNRLLVKIKERILGGNTGTQKRVTQVNQYWGFMMDH